MVRYINNHKQRELRIKISELPIGLFKCEQLPAIIRIISGKGEPLEEREISSLEDRIKELEAEG